MRVAGSSVVNDGALAACTKDSERLYLITQLQPGAESRRPQEASPPQSNHQQSFQKLKPIPSSCAFSISTTSNSSFETPLPPNAPDVALLHKIGTLAIIVPELGRIQYQSAGHKSSTSLHQARSPPRLPAYNGCWCSGQGPFRELRQASAGQFQARPGHRISRLLIWVGEMQLLETPFEDLGIDRARVSVRS